MQNSKTQWWDQGLGEMVSSNWLVDGILYYYPPQRLYASQVKYLEVVNSILQSNLSMFTHSQNSCN